MLQIINELFINCTIIIASVTFANMLMRERFFGPSLRNHLIKGFLSGILGCVLMLYSVSITPEIILDFRFIPIAIMGLYVSLTSTIEATLMIAVFRVAYFGMNKASLVSAIITLLVGFGCGFLGKASINIRIKWLLSLTLICLGSSIGLSFVMPDAIMLGQVILVFLTSMTIVCFMMYFFIEFIAESNRKYLKLKDENEKDYLTDLNNARHFGKALNQCVERAIDEQNSVSLLFIDIDYFKRINDEYGHLNGDAVLKELSKILRRMARSQDIVTRKGGEEFTVLLIGCQLLQAAMVGERIRKTIESYDFRLSGNKSARITVSIGISSIPETANEQERLIEQADTALYQAKRTGRNRVELAH